jgi:hypothetical protein
MVGRVVSADDFLWPVVKSFLEQWKALLEKKKADVGQAPKLTKDRVIHKWLESFQQLLFNKIGVRNGPFTYLTCPQVAPPVFLPRVPGEPYSSNFISIEDKLRFFLSHVHNLYQPDNNALYQMVERATCDHRK